MSAHAGILARIAGIDRLEALLAEQDRRSRERHQTVLQTIERVDSKVGMLEQRVGEQNGRVGKSEQAIGEINARYGAKTSRLGQRLQRIAAYTGLLSAAAGIGVLIYYIAS